MLSALGQRAVLLLFLSAWGSAILATGCFPRFTVDRSAPPLVDLRDSQPVAILPPADAPGFKGSGPLLMSASREVLYAKNFAVTAPEKGVQTLQEMTRSSQEISQNPVLLLRFGEILRSRTIFVATILDYRRQESYFSSSPSKVWHGTSYEYQSLPTYHQGNCEMKVSLKMLDAEKGTVVFAAEGRASGPTGTQDRILRQLVETLMKDLPLLPLKRE